MADIVLGLGTSHSPLLSVPSELWASYSERDKKNSTLYRIPDGKHVNYDELLEEVDPSVAKEITQQKFDARHEANQRGIARVAQKLAEVNPDVLVMFGDDQSEVFNVNSMPAVCVFWEGPVPFQRSSFGREDESSKSIEAYYGSGSFEYPIDASLGSHIVTTMMDHHIDTMQVRKLPEGKTMSHAFGFVWRRIMGEKPIPTVPIHLNTYFPPNQPTPERSITIGKAVREAIKSWDPGKRVAVLGSGGFSHFVVDEELDRKAMKALQEHDQKTLAALPVERLKSGTSEIRNWIAAGAALEDLDMDVYDYVPCYRSPAGTGCAMGFAAWE
jgi:3-O-methylgallate 3,4-dioxygenase